MLSLKTLSKFMLAVGLTVSIAACGTTDSERTAYWNAQTAKATAWQNIEVARAQTEGLKYIAAAKAVEQADASAKTAAAMSIAMGGAKSSAPADNSSSVFAGDRAPETTEQKARAWAGLFINGVMPWWMRDRDSQRANETAQVQSNNNAAVQMNTNNTMLGLGLGDRAIEANAPIQFYTDSFTVNKPEPTR